MVSILEQHELPTWFTYPEEYLRLVEQNVIDLTPWHILDRDEAVRRMDGIRKRYAKRELVPFAIRQDNSWVACWEKSVPGRVLVINDFASEGWESVKEHNTFWEWFRSACEDMIGFE